MSIVIYDNNKILYLNFINFIKSAFLATKKASKNQNVVDDEINIFEYKMIVCELLKRLSSFVSNKTSTCRLLFLVTNMF